MNPEVSVVIPAYNSEKYLAKALKSVFNQSYRNFEIILIDDASTDLTVKIAKSFNDKRLKILKNEQNKGVSYSRNLGITEAKGKWIALLDSDDWYGSERLEKLLAVANLKDADLIADDLFLVNEGESQHWSTFLTEDSHHSLLPITLIDAVKFVASDRLNPISAKRNWSLGYVKPLIRREFLLRNNISYNHSIDVGEDFVLYLECLRKNAKFYLVSEPYYYYQTRDSSLSSRKPLEYLTQSCEITQRFINLEVCSAAQLHLLQALLQNLSIFQKRIEYYRVVESIKNKKLWEVIEQVIDSPYVVGDLCQRLKMALMNRISRLINSLDTKDEEDQKRCDLELAKQTKSHLRDALVDAGSP